MVCIHRFIKRIAFHVPRGSECLFGRHECDFQPLCPFRRRSYRWSDTGYGNSFLDGVFVITEGVEGIPIVFASRLLPRSLAVTDPAKAAKIMLSLDGGVTIL